MYLRFGHHWRGQLSPPVVAGSARSTIDDIGAAHALAGGRKIKRVGPTTFSWMHPVCGTAHFWSACQHAAVCHAAYAEATQPNVLLAVQPGLASSSSILSGRASAIGNGASTRFAPKRWMAAAVRLTSATLGSALAMSRRAGEVSEPGHSGCSSVSCEQRANDRIWPFCPFGSRIARSSDCCVASAAASHGV